MKTNNANPFTANHEPLGFFVQSQEGGGFMILRLDGHRSIRAMTGIPYYMQACNAADLIARTPVGAQLPLFP